MAATEASIQYHLLNVQISAIFTGQTDRQTGRQVDRQTDRQTDRQVDRQTGRQVDRQAGRQADRQTLHEIMLTLVACVN